MAVTAVLEHKRDAQLFGLGGTAGPEADCSRRVADFCGNCSSVGCDGAFEGLSFVPDRHPRARDGLHRGVIAAAWSGVGGERLCGLLPARVTAR